VRAAVRAAHAVDRVQRREDHQHQDGREPAHLTIMCHPGAFSPTSLSSIQMPQPIADPTERGESQVNGQDE
jgi:hypothetical protein